MTGRPRRRLRVFAGFAVLALALGGCGGHGGGSTESSADAPNISDLAVRAVDAERANQTVRYIVAFNVTDRNGDVVNGECEVLLNGQSIGRTPITPVAGTDPNLTQGAVACAFVVRAPAPQQISGVVHIFDRAGHQSNDLAFVLGIHETIGRGIPEGTPGAVEGRMESATMSRSR